MAFQQKEAISILPHANSLTKQNENLAEKYLMGKIDANTMLVI